MPLKLFSCFDGYNNNRTAQFDAALRVRLNDMGVSPSPDEFVRQQHLVDDSGLQGFPRFSGQPINGGVPWSYDERRLYNSVMRTRRLSPNGTRCYDLEPDWQTIFDPATAATNLDGTAIQNSERLLQAARIFLTVLNFDPGCTFYALPRLTWTLFDNGVLAEIFRRVSKVTPDVYWYESWSGATYAAYVEDMVTRLLSLGVALDDIEPFLWLKRSGEVYLTNAELAFMSRTLASYGIRSARLWARVIDADSEAEALSNHTVSRIAALASGVP